MKPIFFLALICLALNVFAWSEGDRLTQIQVDAIDPNTVSLQCGGKEIFNDINARAIGARAFCLTIEYVPIPSQPLRPYLIIKETRLALALSYKQARDDILEYGLLPALQLWTINATDNFRNFKLGIRTKIRGYQTQDMNDLLTGWGIDQNEMG